MQSEYFENYRIQSAAVNKSQSLEVVPEERTSHVPTASRVSRAAEPVPGEESDDQLVARFKAGDVAAFQLLVERYEQRVRTIAYGVVRNTDLAEDLAQEAFIKLYKYLPSFKGESSFYTWFYRIVLNLGIDYTRKRRRQSAIFVDKQARQHEAYSVDRDADFAAEGAGPDVDMDRKELRGQINEAMAQLSADHRMVIMLREVEGLSYQEISEVVGCSKGTVMSRLHHARKRLQKFLTPFLQGEK